MTGVVAAAGARTRTLGVTITGGDIEAGTSHSLTMAGSTATVTGGSGSYSYAWSLALTSGDTAYWDFTGQGTATISPTVHAAFAGENTTADLTCTVTDAAGGATAGSNTQHYQYVNIE